MTSGQQRAGLRLWDRLILLIAWSVTCGLVFVLGFYVGRTSREPGMGRESVGVRLPVTVEVPPAGQAPAADSELTFYDRLGVADGAGREEADEAPSVASTPTTLRAVRAPPSTLSRPPPTTVPPARAASSKPTPTTVPARPTAPRVSAEPEPPPGQAWMVKAGPTRDRAQAEALRARLDRRGYDASIERIVRDGLPWYRVRVGRFGSAERATAVMRTLREDEGVARAFVASE